MTDTKRKVFTAYFHRKCSKIVIAYYETVSGNCTLQCISDGRCSHLPNKITTSFSLDFSPNLHQKCINVHKNSPNPNPNPYHNPNPITNPNHYMLFSLFSSKYTSVTS